MVWFAQAMVSRVLASLIVWAVALPATAAAQDPAWQLIRPNVTLDNAWRVDPLGRTLHAVLDDPLYTDQRPVVTGDRAAATRRRQRFAVGFSNVASNVDTFAGGQVWIYIGIRKGTRVDIAARTRRQGSSVIISSRRRITPPVVIEPEDPPVGPNGFRGWLPLTLPPLTRAEANHLSLAVRISPSSPRRSLSRAYAVFAELYPS
jgi:hypothetical protein